MTEHEWLTSTDPQAMLRWLTCAGPSGSGEADLKRWRDRPSDRKLRLFTCACCRSVWAQLPDPRSRRVVEVAELYADGQATETDIHEAREEVRSVGASGTFKFAPFWTLPKDVRDAAVSTIGLGRSWPEGSAAVQAHLLRDIFGNPFRPVRLSWVVSTSTVEGSTVDVYGPVSWLTPQVVSLAEEAYQQRSDDSSLDLTRLAMLAEAAEDAGCSDYWLLASLRGEELCPVCLAGVERKRCRTMAGGNPDCFEGTVFVRRPRYRGLWSLDLCSRRD